MWSSEELTRRNPVVTEPLSKAVFTVRRLRIIDRPHPAFEAMPQDSTCAELAGRRLSR